MLENDSELPQTWHIAVASGVLYTANDLANVLFFIPIQDDNQQFSFFLLEQNSTHFWSYLKAMLSLSSLS